MPVLVLQKINSTNFSMSFDEGEHVLGRGPKLQCTSKKVSRKHGVLKYTNGEGIFLKATHNNPCFYQKSNASAFSILTFGNSIKISNNDKIALALEDGWFKIQIKDDQNDHLNTSEPQIPSNSNTGELINSRNKRDLIDEAEDIPAKKSKTEDASNASVSGPPEEKSATSTAALDGETTIETSSEVPDVIIKTEPIENADGSSAAVISGGETCTNSVRVKEEPPDLKPEGLKVDESTSGTSKNAGTEGNSREGNVVKSEPEDAEDENRPGIASEAEEGGDGDVKMEVKTEPEEKSEESTEEMDAIGENSGQKNGDGSKSDEESCKNGENKGGASTSGANSRVWRDRCWYGSSCYRKNPQHKVEFKHPGDSDYDSDPGDSRPICCYGVTCYRKNKDHRKRYRHPGQNKLGMPSPRSPNAPRKRRARAAKNPAPPPDSEPDSYDYSDPFINDDSSDEYEPSQETSETESDYDDEYSQEDTKRTLQEGRRFTRNTK